MMIVMNFKEKRNKLIFISLISIFFVISLFFFSNNSDNMTGLVVADSNNFNCELISMINYTSLGRFSNITEIAIDNDNNIHLLDLGGWLYKYAPGNRDFSWARGSSQSLSESERFNFSITGGMTLDKTANFIYVYDINARIRKFSIEDTRIVSSNFSLFSWLADMNSNLIVKDIAADNNIIYAYLKNNNGSSFIRKFNSEGLRLLDYENLRDKPISDLFIINNKLYIFLSKNETTTGNRGTHVYEYEIMPFGRNPDRFLGERLLFTILDLSPSFQNNIKYLDNFYSTVDSSLNLISKIDTAGNIYTFGTAGTGNGQFNKPRGIAIDSQGYIYVVDSGNRRVQKLLCSNQRQVQQPQESCSFVRSFGTSGLNPGQFGFPTNLEFDSDKNLYVVDYSNSRVQKFNRNGNFILTFGSQGNARGQFNWGLLGGSADISVDKFNNVYVMDGVLKTVQKFSKFGSPLLYVNLTSGRFASARLVAMTSKDFIYVITEPIITGAMPYKKVLKFDLNGNYISDFGDSGQCQSCLGFLFDVKIDTNNNILVLNAVESNNNFIFRITKFNPNGQFISALPIHNSSDLPSFVTFNIDNLGNYYFPDYYNHKIRKYDSSGNLKLEFGSEGLGNGEFRNPWGAELLENNIYISDMINNRIQQFNCSFSYPPPVLDTRTSRPELPLINTTVQPGQVLCSDSDGNNPRVFGRVTSRTENSVEQYNDKCIRNSNFLWEYTCSNNGLWKENCYKCASCYNGRCLNSFKRHGIAQCESEERWQNR